MINTIVTIKQRNPQPVSPRIAQLINHTFGLNLNKDVVHRILKQYYKPGEPGRGKAPSRLPFIGYMKDSLWNWQATRGI